MTESEKPAAFVINYSASVVLSLIETGINVHEPKQKAKPKRKKARTVPKADKVPPPQYDPRSVSFDALDRVKAQLDCLEYFSRISDGYDRLSGIAYAAKVIRNAINSNANCEPDFAPETPPKKS